MKMTIPNSICAFLIALAIFSLQAQAAYYIASDGDNNNDGLSAQTPLKTIDGLDGKTLSPGDSVLFRRGEVFVGQIEAKSSGTSAAPIYYGAYGQGGNPIISGAVDSMSFSQGNGGVFEASVASTVKAVHLGDKSAILAREPNEGFYSLSAVTRTSLTDPDHLSAATDYFKDANIRIRSSNYTYEARTITSSSGNAVNWNGDLYYEPNAQWGYYLDGHRAFLDAPNEWYYDRGTRKLFLYSANNPVDRDVRASVYDIGINFRDNVSHIIIENIDFKYQAETAVNVNGTSSNVTVRGCGFYNIGKHGFSCHTLGNSRIQENQFMDVYGSGIYCHSITNTTISNNQLKRTGLRPGFGQVGTFPLNNNIGISSANGADNHVHHNTIDSSGYCGIRTDGERNVVEKNYIRNSLLTLTDGGGFYCWGDRTKDGIVRDNVIVNTLGGFMGKPNHHNIAVGIYLDNKVHGMTIENNIVLNSGTLGILCNQGTRKNTLKGNVVYEFGETGLLFPENTSDYSNVGNEIAGNTFIGLSDTVYCVKKKTNNSVDNYNPGQWKDNRYVNPYNTVVAQSSKVGGKHVHRELSFDAWKSLVGESNSGSRFLGWNLFETTDTTGTEMVTNGSFDNDLSGWGSWSNGDKAMTHIVSSGLDGGALRFEITSDNSIGFSIGSLQNGFTRDLWYQISFSIVSEKLGNVTVTPKRNYNPYSGILYRAVPFFTNRMDYRFTFQANDDVDPARLDFQISSEDGSFQLDNVSVLPVAVDFRDPHQKIKLFYNASDDTKVVQLGNHRYRDLDDVEVCGPIELSPWTSRVLIKNDAECSQTMPQRSGPASYNGLNAVRLRYLPVHNSVFIISDEPMQSVSVDDCRGRRLVRLDGIHKGWCRIPLSGMSHGVYFFTIQTASGRHTIQKHIGAGRRR